VYVSLRSKGDPDVKPQYLVLCVWSTWRWCKN